ncbi:MAG: hypothetical protein ABIR92_08015 [Gemmatimonadaceae bacterium]
MLHRAFDRALYRSLLRLAVPLTGALPGGACTRDALLLIPHPLHLLLQKTVLSLPVAGREFARGTGAHARHIISPDSLLTIPTDLSIGAGRRERDGQCDSNQEAEAFESHNVSTD